MIALKTNELEIVQKIIEQQIPHQDIYVFGSRATKNYKPHSDLDLCVRSEHPLSLQQLSELHEAFSNSDLPMRVDIVDWATASQEFRAIIQKNAIQLKRHHE